MSQFYFILYSKHISLPVLIFPMHLKIYQIPTATEKFTITFIILKQIDSKPLKSQTLTIYQVGDETGTIEFGLYDITLNLGDIITIENAYGLIKENRVRVFAGINKNIKRVGTFRMIFRLEPDYSNVVK